MKIDFKYLPKRGRKSLIILILTLVLTGISLFLELAQKAEADLVEVWTEETPEDLVILQGNSLFQVADINNPEPKVVKTMQVVITAYSSSPLETDDTPFVTAAGTLVKDGTVANNKYPLGTKIRIPGLYGDKIFVIEDRLHWSKGGYQVDIWFPSRQDALNFGAKRTYIEILGS